MAAPNLATITPTSGGIIKVLPKEGQVTNAAVSILSNAAGSDEMVLLTSIYLTNRAAFSGTISVYIQDIGGGNIRYLLEDVPFAVAQILECLEKAQLLDEDRELMMIASANNFIDYEVTYVFAKE